MRCVLFALRCGRLWRLVLFIPGRLTPTSNPAFASTAFYRWHITVVPRLGAGAMAGFEFASGMHSNGNFPEDDAAFLRDVDIG